MIFPYFSSNYVREFKENNCIEFVGHETHYLSSTLMKKIQGLQALHGATLGVVLMQQGHLIVYFNNHFPLSIICINIHSGVACHKELMFKSIQTLKQHVYL